MQEKRFLLITGVLVALLGVPAAYSVVQEPREVIAAQERAKEEIIIAASSAQRAPAQIAQDPNPRGAIKSKSVILDYSCKKQNQTYEVDGTLIRLKGNSCISETWKDVSVINQTNGFTASVIFLKNKSFTTDFIDLKEGENKLSIQAVDETGRTVVQTFSVVRRFPASAESSSAN